MGSTSEPRRRARREAEFAQQRKEMRALQLRKQFQEDPLLTSLQDDVLSSLENRRDFMSLFRTGAAQAADVQSQNINRALAGRGGGSLASSLSLGAQGRVGAETQAMQTGAQLNLQQDLAIQNMINQVLGAKYGTLAGLLSQQAGATDLYSKIHGVETAFESAVVGGISGSISEAIGGYLGSLGGSGGGA